MKIPPQAFPAWLILTAIVLLLTPLSVYFSLCLGAIGGLLWAAAERQPYDWLGVCLFAMIILAFLVPFPLPPITTSPLRLALVVGGWTLGTSLVVTLAAAHLTRKKKRDTAQQKNEGHSHQTMK